MVQYRRTLKRDITGTEKEKRALRSRQQRVCYTVYSVNCIIVLFLHSSGSVVHALSPSQNLRCGQM